MKGLSARQEAFCQAFVQIPVAGRAAVAAGYAPGSARNQGYRLLGNAAVQARIRDLRDAVARTHAARRADLLAKLEAVYQRAMEDHQYAAAGRAVALQAALQAALGPDDDAGTTNDDIVTTDDDIGPGPRRFLSSREKSFGTMPYGGRPEKMTTEDDGRRRFRSATRPPGPGESGCKGPPGTVRLGVAARRDGP